MCSISIFDFSNYGFDFLNIGLELAAEFVSTPEKYELLLGGSQSTGPNPDEGLCLITRCNLERQ